jgi:hypothetical protein
LGCARAAEASSALELPQYLVGRDGDIAEVFPETVEPADTRVKTAIARLLANSWRNASKPKPALSN